MINFLPLYSRVSKKSLLYIVAMVLNVQVQLQPNITSVRVVWDKVNVPGISSYTVYYSTEGESEQFRSVPSSENSVVIMDLRSDAEYRFQVVAIGTVNRQEISGERSVITDEVIIMLPTTMPSKVRSHVGRNAAIAISVIIIIIILLLLMGWAIVYSRTGSVLPFKKK